MQQTEKRGFSIIETSDAFSPQALNDNTRKIEAALDAHEAAVKEVTDDLDARLAVFEAKHFAYGSYVGDNSERKEIHLGFPPKFVIIGRWGSYQLQCIMVDAPHPKEIDVISGLFDDGFWVFNGQGWSEATVNTNGATYCYLAIG